MASWTLRACFWSWPTLRRSTGLSNAISRLSWAASQSTAKQARSRFMVPPGINEPQRHRGHRGSKHREDHDQSKGFDRERRTTLFPLFHSVFLLSVFSVPLWFVSLSDQRRRDEVVPAQL